MSRSILNWFLLCVPLLFSLVRAQGPVQTLFPAGIPLAVKSPYLSVWYASVNGSNPLSNSWTQFWSLSSDIGMEGRIRVNGTTYQWMGNDGTGIANVTNIQITPTRSIFVMQAGPMNITITFLSPVEPDDWVKQSIPFSYISVEAQSLDGNSYPVQLYTDISAELASGDRYSMVQWNEANTGSSIYHNISLQSPQQNFENANQAQDGTVYYAMSTSQSGISWEVGNFDTVRDGGFQTNGKLTNTATAGPSNIQASNVFAFAVDLGTIQSTASPVTWSLGYVRDPSITYTMPSGAIQQRRPYYVTQYKDVQNVIDAFTGDYAAALGRAVALDQKLMSAAAKISSQYADLVSLATRQAMGTLDFTVGTDSSGNLLPNDIKIFMKNLGSDRRVIPVERLYAAFPMFLYLNASIAGALLEPLMDSQATLTGQMYAAMDLGTMYPAATGSRAVPNEGVEESGNMLIMELAHARISGNGTLLSQYYTTTKRWADYLVSNALNMSGQSNQDYDNDDLANTALKGIIGVKAMAEIAHALGEDADAAQYGNQASSLLNSWLSMATASGGGHLLGGYGKQGSWSLMYDVFADKLLGLNFVPQQAIDLHTQYLKSQLATSSEWGLAIDDGNVTGNAAWTMFTSAFVSDTGVRDDLINGVHNHANSNISAGVFSETYDTTNNSKIDGVAGPALGGVFSHLALTLPNQTISGGSASETTKVGSQSSTNVGAIAGGVVGGVAGAGIIVAIVVIVLRKRRKGQYEAASQDEVTERPPYHPTLTPHYQNASSDYKAPATSGPTAGDMGSFASNGVSPSPVPSSTKARRRDALPPQSAPPQSAPSAATSSSAGGEQTGTAPNREPPSPRGSISTTDVVGLRTEMENLRRVVQEMRAERLEPPPEYVEE